MPVDYSKINPILRNIYSNFNGSNVSFGQLLLFGQMLEAAQISDSFKNPKAIAELALAQFKLLSTVPVGAMTASQHAIGSGSTATAADKAGDIVKDIASPGKLTDRVKTPSVAPKLDGVKNLGLSKGALGGITGGGGIMGAASGALDAVSGLIKNRPEYSGKYGTITKGMDAAYDTVKNIVGKVPGFGLIASLAMGAGKLLNKAVGRLGGGTDGMTKADAILGSNFLGLTPIGLINGFGGKKADTYTRNEELDKSTNGGFSGFLTTQTGTEVGAGKKFGLFSRSAMNKQNALTEFTTNMKHTVSGVVDTNTLNNLAAQGSIPFLAQRQQVDLSGGIQQMRAAKHGMQFSRRVISKYQVGNKLKLTILTIDIADGKFVEIPLNLTKELIKGKEPIKLPGGKVVFMNDNGTVTSDRWETIELREHITPKGEKGLKTKPKYEDWVKTVPKSRLDKLYDLKTAYLYYPWEQLEAWRTATDEELDSGLKHLGSIVELPNGNYMFVKLGTEELNPELHFETDTYYNGSNGLKNTHDLKFINGRYWYLKKNRPNFLSGEFIQNGNIVSAFKEGGQMNVIPEGALHARLHHLDLIDPELAKEITHKGIPVITVEKNGEIVQHAEIEHSEIIFTLEVTNKIEDLRKKYHENKKDEYAIEAGKILVTEILHNTDDRTNLIANVE